MATRIQLRRDTSARWATNNPTLALGEMGIETDTKKFKFGDGNTAWNALGYAEDANVVKKEIISGTTTKSYTCNAITDGSLIHGVWGAYPGKIYGITIQNPRVLTDFIELPKANGDTLVMETSVVDLTGEHYGAIQLYNHPNNSGSNVIDYFKRDGSKNKFSNIVSFSLSCEADTSLTTSPYYNFVIVDENTRKLYYNPEYVKYMRCFIDQSVAEYTYTATTSVNETELDITNGIIKTTTSSQVYHYVNIQRGSLFDGYTYVYSPESPTVEAGTKVSITPIEGGTAKSVPVRTFTEMIEIKEGGIVFDESLYDYTGSKYYSMCFYDENQEFLAGYDGVNNQGLGTITSNKVIIDNTITDNFIEVVSSLTRVELRIPETFKYMRVALTASPDYGVENGGLQARYHYLNEEPAEVSTITTLSEYIKGSIEKDTSYSWSKNYGKTVGVFGGSFATSTYAQSAYDLWTEKLDLTINNYAVSGAGFCKGTTFNTQATSATVADIYVIWCSTNDFTKGSEIGESTDEAGTNTQWGAFKQLLATLYGKNPNAKICLFTSSPHLTQAKGNEEGIGTQGSQTYTLRQFVEAQQAACQMYSIPCLDQYFTSGQNSFNQSLVCKSGDFHLTAFGYSMLSNKQISFLANL